MKCNASKQQLIIIPFSTDRLNKIPSLHTLKKELFKAAVCFKPRLIRMGLENLENKIEMNEVLEQMGQQLGELFRGRGGR